MGQPIVIPALSRAGIYTPPAPVARIVTNDNTSGLVIGAQLAGYVFNILGANLNRVYVLIQNNTTVSLAIGVGSPNNKGIVLLAGGYYERQFYTFTQQIYGTLLGASVAGDYVTVEEGSSQATQ